MSDKYQKLGFNDDILQKLWGFAFKKDVTGAVNFLKEVSTVTQAQAKHIFDSVLVKYNTPELNKILDMKPIIQKALSIAGFDQMADAAPAEPVPEANAAEKSGEPAVTQAEPENATGQTQPGGATAEPQSPAALDQEAMKEKPEPAEPAEGEAEKKRKEYSRKPIE